MQSGHRRGHEYRGSTKVKRNLTVKKQILRLAALVATGCVVIAGARYGIDEWQGRDWVSRQVEGAEFQHTSHGNHDGVFCGEVSGVNGLGMRTPYMRFVATLERVDIAPLTLDREKVETFGREWDAQCE